MAEKNLVEETLIQIQNLEEVINENAKEILASTMKEEISELVKESMKDETKEESEETNQEVAEAEEDEFEMEDSEEEEGEESEEEDTEEDEFEMEDSEEDDEESEDMMMSFEDDETDFDSDEDTVNLVGEPDSAVLDVFLKAGPDDEFIVQKDGDYLHITDSEADREYLVKTEGEEAEYEYELEESEDNDEEGELEEGNEELVYELELEESEDNDEEGELEEIEESEYEYELEEDENTEFEFELEEDSDGYPEEDNEGYNYMSESKKMKKKMETKEGMKARVGKGAAKPGSAKKFSYKTSKGGFKENMKHANPTKGTGKPKFEFKEGEMMDMPSKMPKLSKEEAKEAARTYGMGWRKGALPKGARTGSKKARQDESVMDEVQMLRTKNEEYRKALNLFRDKLNEVAIFNSNLAYATRLFTEHSTSKHEKINILRRFDSAETLKESKALYKTIKDELSQGTKSTPITESIERVIDREPQSGSAINLIESKTYENPQFLRMKDIMSKIAK
jgi:hypothetical protein